MSPVEILNPQETVKLLLRWEKSGPSKEEREEFLTDALEQLADPQVTQGFADNISDIAYIAEEIERTFVDVEGYLWLFALLASIVGLPLLEEWLQYEARWRDCLRLSVKIASTTSDILIQFDQIYLAEVENIKTEQDRLAAIKSLERFKAQLDAADQSDVMSRKFLDLKRDVAAFVDRFNTMVNKNLIDPLLKNIEALDRQIKDLQRKFGAVGGFSEVLGLAAHSSSLIASLKALRQKKAEELRDIHLAMAAINKLVTPSVQQTRAIVAPDINLMLDRLVGFAEIWSSVQSQTVQFSGHIQGGLDTATNIRFKSEIKVAREACTPLRNGLLEYKRQLESWINN